MSGRPISSFGLRALARDSRTFAVFGTLLLAFQLLLSGWTAGAMAGERSAPGAILCSGMATPVDQRPGGPKEKKHASECPCIIGAGCSLQVAPVPPGGPSIEMPQVARDASIVFDAAPDRMDRRPLSLFARAGRGPPSLS